MIDDLKGVHTKLHFTSLTYYLLNLRNMGGGGGERWGKTKVRGKMGKTKVTIQRNIEMGLHFMKLRPIFRFLEGFRANVNTKGKT